MYYIYMIHKDLPKGYYITIIWCEYILKDGVVSWEGIILWAYNVTVSCAVGRGILRFDDKCETYMGVLLVGLQGMSILDELDDVNVPLIRTGELLILSP